MSKRKYVNGNVPNGIPAVGNYDMVSLHQVAQAFDLCFAALDQTAWRFQLAVRNVSVAELYDRDFDPDTIDDLHLTFGAMEVGLHIGVLKAANELELVHQVFASDGPRLLMPAQFGRDLCKTLTGAHWDVIRINPYSARSVR